MGSIKLKKGKDMTDEQYVLDSLEILLAVNLLEYHDKNWLSGDNKTRCENKIRLIQEAITKQTGIS